MLAAPPGTGLSRRFRRTEPQRGGRLPSGRPCRRRTRQPARPVRLHYGPAYYAAFVIDPDGHAIEAVFKDPV